MTAPDLTLALCDADLTSGLNAVTTRFVALVESTRESAPSDSQTAYARDLVARCGLKESPVPLLVLTGHSDSDALDRYRAWVLSAQPELLSDPDAGVAAYLRLLPFHQVAASLHGLDVVADGSAIRLTGTCRRGGADGELPPDHDARLLFLDASGTVVLTAPTSPCRRFERGARRWTGFVADVPLSELPVGTSGLAVELAVPRGQPDVRASLAATPGVLASSRPVSVAGLRFQALPVRRSPRVVLSVRQVDNRWSRVRSGLTTTRRDLADLCRRTPFAWARPLRLLTRPLMGRRPIWLIGERPDTARDNGYHLFAYLARERPDIRSYYVIDRTSDQRSRVAGMGRVVAHSSWRHRLLMLHAAVLANAYSIKHMAPRQWDPSAYMRQFAWRVGSRRVYLKHGINLNTLALRRRIGGYDLYLTASEAETVAARATSGYDQQVALTGLPRYDALVPTPPSRTILFMPTWRLYLAAALFGEEAAEVPFDGSAYQRFMVDLLASTRLADMLEHHGHHLQLMPHYNLGKRLSGITPGSPRISVLDGTSGNIQDLMRECDLFVTDHSSVHFDLAYLGTPVVYAHFDADDYRRGHAAPSWFDHERDGFGPVTHDLAGTLDAIEHYLVNGCVREPEYDRRAEQAFAFHDRDNSRRATDAIEALLVPLDRPTPGEVSATTRRTHPS
ncbi:CDP-glycerol glycerophosphotransferase family protein [Aeromicrobium sp.]|uniref:CDP-glycerol glycerophosphotransferase family protein n=1 Tax=Aeromicrobium sp. TaxID=1871063 RepID=UPI0019B30800|nr:CDP-glycerol glycerophosphotransferase family protein [Aeromicrobium sp.]MBC7631148.1 CDP-glycerol glycerophosphotransferase family protein [Aeromicrobium sp.]